MTDADDVRLTSRQLRQRYGVTDMSLYRWSKDPKLAFPQPLRINNRRYWPLSAIVEWERSRVATRSAA